MSCGWVSRGYQGDLDDAVFVLVELDLGLDVCPGAEVFVLVVESFDDCGVLAEVLVFAGDLVLQLVVQVFVVPDFFLQLVDLLDVFLLVLGVVVCELGLGRDEGLHGSDLSFESVALDLFVLDHRFDLRETREPGVPVCVFDLPQFLLDACEVCLELLEFAVAGAGPAGADAAFFVGVVLGFVCDADGSFGLGGEVRHVVLVQFGELFVLHADVFVESLLQLGQLV